MKERPILMSGPMVVATLNGSKTETRRIIRPPTPSGQVFAPREGDDRWYFRDVYYASEDNDVGNYVRCPYGVPGDFLWVRETWATCGPSKEYCRYKATSDGKSEPVHPRSVPWKGRWAPSIHMPRWASRINLQVISVRVERLKSIGKNGVIAEGLQKDSRGLWAWPGYPSGSTNPIYAFQLLWDLVNGYRDGCKYDWSSNPWVWVVGFKKV